MNHCKNCFYFQQLDPQASIGRCNVEPENVQALTVPDMAKGGFEVKQAVLYREVHRNRPECRHFITTTEKENV